MGTYKKPGKGGSGSPTSRIGPIVETGRSKINLALPTYGNFYRCQKAGVNMTSTV